MKAIAQNLYLHPNGHYYALWTANGKTERRSLGTKKLSEAKRALKRIVVPTAVPAAPQPPNVLNWPNLQDGDLAQAALQNMLAGVITTLLRQAPSLQGGLGGNPSAVLAALIPSLAPEANGSSAPPSSAINGESPGQDRPPFTQAVADHHANTAFTSRDTERNFVLQQKKVLMRCGGNWAKFEPVPIWKEIQVKKFKSAPNQMRWYLRSFVDYGREKKWFNDSMLMEVRRIPLLKVNPRRIKMPPPEQTEEWLKMCELENQELGSFIRFLATTGLRKSGGNTLRWEEVDLCNHQLRPTMKGGEEEKFPMIPEAYALLDNRSKEAGRPNSGFIWNFSDRQLKKATRIMKKYAKGLGLGLTYFHALRHHFASVALSQGMSPADVAKMLGHKDGGKLICEVYGHVIDTDLKSKAENMRIFGKAESKSNNAENPNTRS